ncbi:MAG: sigma-70 family RNA polymerase sigma factor [Phycisphaerales bacterium]
MENESPSNVELMARVGRDDMAALGVLAQRHRVHVLSLAYRLLGDWHEAEDIAQETFLRVRQAARGYEPQAKFTTWLYRIIHNLSMDRHRRAARAPLPLEAAQEIQTEDPSRNSPAERAELTELVQKAIAQLSDRQRRVVVLHRYEGLSHVEISEVTGWSKSAVESLLVRAYENLRKNLAEHEDFAR